MINTVILSISDTRNKENDISSQRIKDILKTADFHVQGYEIIPDEKDQIKEKLYHYVVEQKADVILTTGGTGLGPRDTTPEATLEVIDRKVPGISEFIRSTGAKSTMKALLSRGISGVKNNTLIINLPGSPRGVEESLSPILEVIVHAIDMIKGGGH